MALDKVVEEILESARKEADGLIQTAEKEKKSILQLAEENVAVSKKAQAKQTEEATKRLRQQELSSAELEAKRILLNARKEMLDRTFDEVMKDLAGLRDEEKSRLYRIIVEKGTKVLPNARIYCPRGESKLVPNGKGEVVEKDIPAGLILESMDGQVSLDYTFKTILEDVWEKELKNVSNILFG